MRYVVILTLKSDLIRQCKLEGILSVWIVQNEMYIDIVRPVVDDGCLLLNN